MYQLSPDEITYTHFNERDIEVPTVLESIRHQGDNIQSVLDVGF